MAAGVIIRVRGQVQGVGFRPHVWRLAKGLGLRGDVRNDAEGVLIRAFGDGATGLASRLERSPPPLADIRSIEIAETSADAQAPNDFSILHSVAGGTKTACAPDVSTCEACIAEIRDAGRRHGYAFTNCTECGPRYSITLAMPYDRASTTMARFEMCAACRKEFETPDDRRFHAQPIACPACGPQLSVVPAGPEPLAAAETVLRGGGIVAVKGLGGFHLACDATQPEAVQRLRTRKRRPTKALALMARKEVLARYATPSAGEWTLLEGRDAPIVLLPRRDDRLPAGIAPGLDHIGWMLPYTPLHHLLLERVNHPVVMTSANLSGRPQVIVNTAACRDLSGVADLVLLNDRDIVRRVDDSLARETPMGPMVLRRGRGQAPGALALPDCLPEGQVLALGGDLKAAICLTKDAAATLSQHLGDLDDPATYREYLAARDDLTQFLDHDPGAIAIDLHPGYRSSNLGREMSLDRGLPLVEIQHHHAHMAAALAEANWTGEVAVGVVLDGLGYGDDGTIWGGEVLVGGYAEARRAVRLRSAPLPGGDQAQREPWRNAVARLDMAGHSDVAERLFPDAPLDLLRSAISAGVNAPQSSSAGRLFDAVAACLGINPFGPCYEGEAAMRLEVLARRAGPNAGAYPLDLASREIDPTPLFDALVEDMRREMGPDVMAARFHAGLASAFADAARESAETAGATTIALTGGCFQNLRLLDEMARHLADFRLCGPGRVPINDGGLALGQAAIALARGRSG